MTKARLSMMDWWAFEATYLQHDAPGTYRIPGDPPVEFFVLPNQSALGLRVPCGGTLKIKKMRLDAVQVEEQVIEGLAHTLLSVSAVNMYRPWYGMMTEIVNLMRGENFGFVDAVAMTLTAWRRLVRTVPTMSFQEQIGLFGELLVLERLLEASPPERWTWTGPSADAHDFRFESYEIEAKAHVGSKRVHIISSLDQLRPSQGHTLYIASILLMRAPDGRTLPEQVGRVRDMAPAKLASELDSVLREKRYRSRDAVHYNDRWALRQPIRVVPVDHRVPRITREGLESLLGDVHQRIPDATYRLNLEGLGEDDGGDLVNGLLGQRKA